MATELVEVERNLSEGEWRKLIRQSDLLSDSESERLKRARFATDPTCDMCSKPVEVVEDASYITTPIGNTSTAPHSLFIHNGCLLLTVQKMAIAAHRLGRRR